jgi:AbrB family looped-hinge helix DNA binding protein
MPKSQSRTVSYNPVNFADNNPAGKNVCKRRKNHMKATGIVRRIDDLGRVVIPKEIRRTMRIREGDPSLMTLEETKRFRWMNAMIETGKRCGMRDI